MLVCFWTNIICQTLFSHLGNSGCFRDWNQSSLTTEQLNVCDLINMPSKHKAFNQCWINVGPVSFACCDVDCVNNAIRSINMCIFSKLSVIDRSSLDGWWLVWYLEKLNEWDFRPHLFTYRLNWARITSWGWWNEWDDTVLKTHDTKFEQWQSEAEHAILGHGISPQYWIFTCARERNILFPWNLKANVGFEPVISQAAFTTACGPGA